MPDNPPMILANDPSWCNFAANFDSMSSGEDSSSENHEPNNFAEIADMARCLTDSKYAGHSTCHIADGGGAKVKPARKLYSRKMFA